MQGRIWDEIINVANYFSEVNYAKKNKKNCSYFSGI